MGLLFSRRSPPALPTSNASLRKPWVAFLLVCLLAGTGVVVLTSLVALNELHNTIERVKASNLISAQLIAERLAAMFRDSEAISAHVSTTKHLTDKSALVETRQETQDLISRFTELNYAILTDRHGDMLWNTENDQVGSINYADRTYFKAHESGATFLVGEPIIGRLSGQSVLPVTRAVYGADGGFAGVLFIGVKTAVINDFLSRSTPGAGAVAALWRTDGTMLARYPLAAVGERYPKASVFDRLAVAPSGSYVAASAINGAQRIFGYAAVSNYPMAVSVGTAMDDALADWRLHAIEMAALNVAVLVTLLVLAVRNIKQTSTLFHSVERNRLLLRHASDGVHILDETGALIEASDSFCRMLGYEREELIGKNVAGWDVNFPPDQLAEVVAKQFQSSDVSTFVTRHRRKDGTNIDVEVTGLRMELDGQMVLYNSSRDITERRALESQVRESRDRFAAFAEVSSDWFWEMDRDLRFSWFSDRFGEVIDRDPATVIGLRREELVLGIDPEVLARHLDDLHAHRPFRNFDYPIDTRSGRKFLRISGTPIIDDEKVFIGYRGTGTNVTALVEAEAELRESKLAAEAANRAKSAFLASMSHEIRTPMNGIIGLAHLLKTDHLEPRARERTDAILNSAERLLGIINDILDFSKIEAGKILIESAPFALEHVVKDAVATIAPTAEGKGLRLPVQISPEVPGHLVGDQLRIGQMLLNLLGNAVKFTEHGSIAIAVDANKVREDRICLRFSVKDTGIGLASKQLGTLFQPFQQADSSTTRKFGGTGLGLSIVRRLADLMGGQAGAESEPSVGSTFWFTVTVGIADGSDRPSAAKAELVSPYEPALLRGTNVLLVDDDPVNRMVAVGLLEAARIRVDIATNGAEAVEMVERNGGYEVVLMDTQMPVMDGLTATRRIRTNPKFGDLPIIALTAGVMAEQRQACTDAGMNDFVGKPFTPEKLYSVIQTWATGLGDAGLFSDMMRTKLGGENLRLPGDIQGIDVRAGLRRVAGMKRLYVDALRKYVEGAGDVAARLREMIAAGDITSASREAHTLKGMSGMVEAREIHGLALAIEQVLKTGDAATGNALIDRLEVELVPILAAIRNAVDASEPSGNL